MKTFDNSAAQGEIRITRISSIPKLAVNMRKPKTIIGHSETGHHHVLDKVPSKMFASTNNNGMKILYAILDQVTVLEHLRPFDQHESIALSPGMYCFTIGREYDHYAGSEQAQCD